MAPLLKGGQGRTPESVERDASAIVLTFCVVGALVALWLLARWLA